MTNEEAILTLKVVEEYFDKNAPALGGEAMRMAIDALRTQQTTTKLDRNKLDGCEWCHDEVFFDNEDMELELQHPLEDEPRMVYPNYCPMCGRPLTEEAWAELERRIGGSNGTTDLLE